MKIAVVCDGLGGSGCGKIFYEGAEHTEAWLAARWYCKMISDYFKTNNISDMFDSNSASAEMADPLRKNIKWALDNYCEKYNISKSSFNSLPATTATVIVEEREDYVNILAMWAGDSRAYLLTHEKGLQQISRDDVSASDFDAHFLAGSSEMNNCIETGDFHFNCNRIQVDKSEDMVIFVCSDGCFDGFKSIMELEYYILSSFMLLDDSQAAKDFAENLADMYRSNLIYYSGIFDDTTMAGLIINPTDSGRLKACYQQRYDCVRKIHDCYSEWLRQISAIKAAEPSGSEKGRLSRRLRQQAICISKNILFKSLDHDLSADEQNLYNALLEMPILTRIKNCLEKAQNGRQERINQLKHELEAEIFPNAFCQDVMLNKKNQNEILKALKKDGKEYADDLKNMLNEYSQTTKSYKNQIDIQKEIQKKFDNILRLKHHVDVAVKNGTLLKKELIDAYSVLVLDIKDDCEKWYKNLSRNGTNMEDLKKEIEQCLVQSGCMTKRLENWKTEGYPPF